MVSDRDLLIELAARKPHESTFLKKAPLGIIVLADPQRSDVWVEDSSIASIFIHLVAHSLGLGSCWIQIRERMHDLQNSAGQYVATLLAIPADREVEAIVAIGYPDSQLPNHDRSALDYSKVYSEKYGHTFK